MKSRISAFVAAAVFVASSTASGQAVAPETRLIESPSAVVDAADFEGFLLRVPPERRGAFRMSYDRVANALDGLFVARVLAGRAREAGMDKSIEVQKRLQQVQENLLADIYMQEFDKKAVAVNLEARARELYRAEPDKYKQPETVYVQVITVGLKDGTDEAALKTANEVRAKAKAGEDFLALADKYSDDKARNGGDLGYVQPSQLPQPVRDAVSKMQKGDVSAPIRTDKGFEIVRFIDRRPAQPLKFEQVRSQIIEEEKNNLIRHARERLVREIREAPGVVVHPDNVDKLVLRVDTKKLTEKPATGK